MPKFKLHAMLPMLLFSAIALNGCGHVPVKDTEGCADLGVAGAECAHIYISQKRSLTKAQWDKIRPGWVCMPSDDFSNTFDSIDDLCRNSRLCDYETQQATAGFSARMAGPLSKAIKILNANRSKK